MVTHVQISVELGNTFCTSLPELGKLIFFVQKKLHVPFMTTNVNI